MTPPLKKKIWTPSKQKKSFLTLKKKYIFKIGPPQKMFVGFLQKKDWSAKNIVIGATIRIGREILCLPYTGFLPTGPVLGYPELSLAQHIVQRESVGAPLDPFSIPV